MSLKDKKMQAKSREVEVENDEEEDLDEEPVFLKDLKDGPIENATKAFLEACIEAGKIPLNTSSARLLLNLHLLSNDDGEEEDSQFEVIKVTLTNDEREAALQGLANSWLMSLREMITSRKNMMDLMTEATDLAESVSKEQYLQDKNQYDSVLKEFSKTLKFLYSQENKDEELSDNNAVVQVLSNILNEISGIQDQGWAFNEFTKFPRGYVAKALYVFNLSQKGA